MVYFDNAATTMLKPPEVAQALVNAITSFGNGGRSFHGPAMEAARAIMGARLEIAKLVKLENPLNVAFTSGATESFNLVLDSLVSPSDHVITSVLEHNSVLRPLYKTGCELSFIPCDGSGHLILENLDSLLKANTRFLVCTHGSNLTGGLSDVQALYGFCRKNGLVFILDVSQTLGCVETFASMADILCFTGHKALFGPQGTGGIIVNRRFDFRLVKTGGTGTNSFEAHQSMEMPEIFEAGTQNAHGLAALRCGVEYVNQTGLSAIKAHSDLLLQAFLDGVRDIPGICVYGEEKTGPRLPIVALNAGSLSAGDVALQLWENSQIVTRAGSHCAPLVHKFFKTETQGMVRFSFNAFNTAGEIGIALKALGEIARKGA